MRLVLAPALLVLGCNPADTMSMTDANSDDGVDSDSATTDAPGGDCDVGLSVGQCPPDFTLPSADGSTFSLSDSGAKRVIVLGTSNW